MPAASDVPGKYDLLIDVGGNKTGYLFNEAIETYTTKNLATYGYSPTFVERQNVQGNYGDDSQAFWMTASQNDWSGSEDQRFFRANNDDSKRSYWRGSKVDNRTEGAVSIRREVNAVTLAAASESACTGGNSGNILVTTSTNLYDVDNTGSITDRGAHGLGVAPAMRGMCFDGKSAFITSVNGGSAGVRRYDATAHTFSTFSATPSDVLAFLNNTLYGYTEGVLRRYDSAGTPTTLNTFQNADGTTDTSGGFEKLLPYGGQLVLMVQGLEVSDLWLYDGVGTKRIAAFEPGFQAYDAVVSNGIIFVSGFLKSSVSSANRGAVFYYANGQIGLLHKAAVTSSGGAPCITTFDGGLVWKEIGGDYIYYNPATGSISTFASAAGISPTNPIMVSTPYSFARLGTIGGATFDLFPSSSASVATSATVTSSLHDFDSSLDKLFRGIKIDFDSATDGDFGSVDIAYRVGDVDGSYTTLQIGATSGTEYTLTSTTGRNISVKVTLNRGTSTLGPVLKRVYVRAVPLLQQKKLRKYDIACVGNIDQRQALRDGSLNPKTGRELANDLMTAITSATPVTVYDRFDPSGYTAVLEPAQCEINEIHAVSEAGVKSGEFRATILAREI